MKRYNFDFSKKIFFHPEAIVKYKEGKRPFPITLEVDLTNSCNHKCSFCYYADHINKNSSTLGTENLLERLEEAYELGTRGISFTGGGEPMLHKDFIEILERTKKIGFDIGLMTNGSLITEKKIRYLFDNLQWLRISMAGGDAESYKAVQGVDHFKKLIQVIKMLSDYRNTEKKDLNIGIRTLVTPENIQSLHSFANILKEFNLNYLQLAPDMFTSDEGQFWFSDRTKEKFNKVEEILQQNKIMLLTAGYSWFDDMIDFPRTCYAHFFHSALSAEGELLYCKNARGKEKYYLGNIRENTFKEIWEKSKVKDFESWIKPSNCGLFCKNMALNISLEETIHPDKDLSPNFVN